MEELGGGGDFRGVLTRLTFSVPDEEEIFCGRDGTCRSG